MTKLWLNTVLGQMKLQPDLVIPTLIGATDDADQTVRSSAIFDLGSFGPAAMAAVPKLNSLTNDPDIRVREQAVRARQLLGASYRGSRNCGKCMDLVISRNNQARAWTESSLAEMPNWHSSGDGQFKQTVAMALPAVFFQAGCTRGWAARSLSGRVAG